MAISLSDEAKAGSNWTGISRATRSVPVGSTAAASGLYAANRVAASSAPGIHNFCPISIRSGLSMVAKLVSSAALALVASQIAGQAKMLPEDLSADLVS